MHGTVNIKSTSKHSNICLNIKNCDFDPYKFDPYKFDPYKFDPYKFDPYKFDPYKFDPYKFDPYNIFVDFMESEE